MNAGILTSGYAPPAGPRPMLGSPVPVEMIDAYAYDADALRYIRAVEAADGQRLPLGVRVAVSEFVLGCKADGVWDLLSVVYALCGAATLSGALVPLKGAAATNYNFVSTDYSRRTGLKGNAASKYLLAGISGSSLPQYSHHGFVYGSDFTTSATHIALGSSTGTGQADLFDILFHFASQRFARSGTASASIPSGLITSGSVGLSRQSRQEVGLFQNGVISATATAVANVALTANPVGIFCRNDGANNPIARANCRLSLVTLGVGLTSAMMAQLHARTDTLSKALAST